MIGNLIKKTKVNLSLQSLCFFHVIIALIVGLTLSYWKPVVDYLGISKHSRAIKAFENSDANYGKNFDGSYTIFFLLGSRPTTDKCLKDIEGWENLGCFFALDSHITDNGLHYLNSHMHLKYLYLSGSKGITDQGVGNLGKLDQLRKLCIAETSISLKGFHKLKELLPKCSINFDRSNHDFTKSEMFLWSQSGQKIEIP